MISLTLRSLHANLSRLLLTSLSIVLGVAFLAGTLMFTDGLSRAMTAQVSAQFRNLDVEVTGFPDAGDRVDKVRKVSGVRAAEGTATVTSFGIVGKDGKQVPGVHRADSIPADPALQPLSATEGRLPQAAGELVLDADTARRESFRVGDEIRMGGGTAAARPYRLVGLVSASKAAVEARGAVAGLVLSDVLTLADQDRPDRVVVSADDGVTHAELADRIRAAVDGDVQTQEALIRTAQEAALGDAGTFRAILVGFSVIVVGVAAFVIANTFTIMLAQRTRETALLRLIGATRLQIYRSLLTEAAVVGLAGSLAGVVTGVGLAYGLRAAFAASGAGLTGDLVVTPTTVAIAFAVGTGVTVLAALMPARRGTAVAPVAALSDSEVQDARRTGRVRRGFGVVTMAGGAGALIAAVTARQVELVAAGAVLAVVGFVLLSPVLVPVLVRLLGWPAARMGGATVSLALRNAVRNPRRIAATTNALVIGVTLVASVTMIIESAKAPAERKAAERFGAHFLAVDGTGSTLPTGLAAALREQPELGALSPVFTAIDTSSDLSVQVGYPAILERGYPDYEGSFSALAPGTAVVTRESGVAPGGTITVGGRPFAVVASVPRVRDDADYRLDRTVWLAPADFQTLFSKRDPWLSEVQADPAPGVSAAAARAAFDRVARDFPTVTVYDRAGYTAHLNARLDQGLIMVTALLALAVLVALIGVANTLTLSVVERTRENTLLRAIGITRRQLRGTLAVESLVLALTGTVVGIVASIAITKSGLASVASSGAGLPLVLPWDRLGVLLGVAVVAAFAASVLPARRAARRPIAANLAAE
ncbi:ABC transporter permease [Actinoplanes sp. NPDC051859]|uniref:ABC transporter permease n=1 Tax=Actinoplanes sp. NPDC051859 TaxID=3363909 RepID=UPI003793CF49